ncbi:unnamed protein product [Prorocentrum cordatum]|uniref:Uncharacterized protein n=1 Tax=Prorocentrum cordatum TaxID=2364126 RepID=A0ABN9WZJ8_9DINO|nr:unnamed protein product [Polarella glacialis]
MGETWRDAELRRGLLARASRGLVEDTTTESEVAKLPDSFDDAGPLQLSPGRTTPVRDLSEGEMEELEDCLDAVQRPFPRLRRSTPLMQAVQCAEGLWDSDG